MDPNSSNAQAGLGTCLLLQGVFYNTNNDKDASNDEEGTNMENGGDAQAEKTEEGKQVEQVALLTLATHHLKVASSLCSSLSSTESKVKGDSDINTAASSNNNNAAILHNLALAYLALGETNSSIPVLLKAAALRRVVLMMMPTQPNPNSNSEPMATEMTNGRLNWNAPMEVLQLVEEKALLVGAKLKSKRGSVGVGGRAGKRRRIPFVRAGFDLEELMLMS